MRINRARGHSRLEVARRSRIPYPSELMRRPRRITNRNWRRFPETAFHGRCSNPSRIQTELRAATHSATGPATNTVTSHPNLGRNNCAEEERSVPAMKSGSSLFAYQVQNQGEQPWVVDNGRENPHQGLYCMYSQKATTSTQAIHPADSSRHNRSQPLFRRIPTSRRECTRALGKFESQNASRRVPQVAAKLWRADRARVSA
jgi:hypothetical protein